MGIEPRLSKLPDDLLLKKILPFLEEEGIFSIVKVCKGLRGEKIRRVRDAVYLKFRQMNECFLPEFQNLFRAYKLSIRNCPLAWVTGISNGVFHPVFIDQPEEPFHLVMKFTLPDSVGFVFRLQQKDRMNELLARTAGIERYLILFSEGEEWRVAKQTDYLLSNTYATEAFPYLPNKTSLLSRITRSSSDFDYSFFKKVLETNGAIDIALPE